MKIYVDQKAEHSGKGTSDRPFRTIQEAATQAGPGDEVIVRPGIYREYVNPKRGGSDNQNRITYRAETPGTATITGAELLTGWVPIGKNVWMASVPNRIFGTYHPYTEVLGGDWYMATGILHAGEVYLNGRSLYEAQSLEAVQRGEQYGPSWERERSAYQWYAQVGEEDTVFYVQFQEMDPNENLVEINVRRNCFYPSERNINYITVQGFIIKQAATTWAPPTAYQEGMVGPHWSRGWIIEDCEISDSKCVGISLGKCMQAYNDNRWVREGRKVGTQNERDIVCQAWKEGWNKQNIGGHTVRRCNIHHCEQAGIAGHLGCIFSVIEDNHIHHINNKQLLLGAEIAGIKLHAAIDVQIRRNHIHHCTRGIWLDWQAQGTRVSSNLLHDNVTPEGAEAYHRLGTGEDLFIEISHGPTTVDNNLFLSQYSCRISTQGVAFVNNLFAGSFTMVGYGHNNGARGNHPRYTPYHDPHDTTIAGFMTLLHGDIRFLNNVFIQNPAGYTRFECLTAYGPALNHVCGTMPFEDYPTFEEFEAKLAEPNIYDVERYYGKLPVMSRGNLYLNGAKPTSREKLPEIKEQTVRLQMVENGEGWSLEADFLPILAETRRETVETNDLGVAFEPEERFENPDGSDLIFDRDFWGNVRNKEDAAGPFTQGWIQERMRTEYENKAVICIRFPERDPFQQADE